MSNPEVQADVLPGLQDPIQGFDCQVLMPFHLQPLKLGAHKLVWASGELELTFAVFEELTPQAFKWAQEPQPQEALDLTGLVLTVPGHRFVFSQEGPVASSVVIDSGRSIVTLRMKTAGTFRAMVPSP